MSYVTVEVEMNHRHILPSEPGRLPEKGKGYLTILPSGFPTSGLNPTRRAEPRPIGLAKDEFTVPEDFYAALPEEVLNSFAGK